MADLPSQPATSEVVQPVATPSGFRSGFVALCGRPNVGKSTLLNALLGQELAVATALPQTTRERMLGIWNHERFQAVLVDTPGIHKPKSALNKYMVEEALRAAADVDLILMLAEVPRLDPKREQEQEW
ncbi:MAG: 50S ribosome-binding GTPase, partial [Myxococcales bacterium]|nr:50S ribosome-binding GTPase [Myxococcales bacterium]